MRQWIKLHLDIIDDPKMGRLTDRLFRRAIELFLLAGKSNNNDGVLPPIEDIAWMLRVDEHILSYDLLVLQAVNIVHQIENGIWIVTHFSERQDADTPAERVSNHRKNKTKHYKSFNDGVTYRYTMRNENETNSNVDKDKDKEVEKESEVEAEVEAEAQKEIAAADFASGKSEKREKTPSQKPDYEKEAEIGAVFREYEANIGALTPMIAERISDLLDHYPRDWISAAIREAVAHEARNLKYVEAILKRWKTDGFQSPRQNGKSTASKNNDSVDDMLRDYVQKYPPPKAS